MVRTSLTGDLEDDIMSLVPAPNRRKVYWNEAIIAYYTSPATKFTLHFVSFLFYTFLVFTSCTLLFQVQFIVLKHEIQCFLINFTLQITYFIFLAFYGYTLLVRPEKQGLVSNRCNISYYDIILCLWILGQIPSEWHQVNI